MAALRTVIGWIRSSLNAASPPPDADAVDLRTKSLQQGDFRLGNPQISTVQANLLNTVNNTRSEQTEGLVIISQTCDIIRSYTQRPFVQLAALTFLPIDKAEWARKGHQPNLVHLPGAGHNAFANLDIVLTTDKSAIHDLRWQNGVRTPEEMVRFGEAIGRKCSRYPFPNDFQESLRKLAERIRTKYIKASPESEVLHRIEQIRVEVYPEWSDENQFEATLIFILREGEVGLADEPSDPGPATRSTLEHAEIHALCEAIVAENRPTIRGWLWDRLAEKYVALCNPRGLLTNLSCEVVSADDFTAARMWTSQRFDIDYLSALDDAI